MACQEIEFGGEFDEITRDRLGAKTIAKVKARIGAFNDVLQLKRAKS